MIVVYFFMSTQGDDLHKVVPAGKSLMAHRMEICAKLLVEGRVMKMKISAIPAVPLARYNPEQIL